MITETTPRPEAQERSAMTGEDAATLERLDFTVQGPSPDALPMNVTLCTSTTTTCSCGKKLT